MKSHHIFKFVIIIMMLFLITQVTGTQNAQADQSLEEQALAFIADEHGLRSDELVLVDLSELKFDQTGVTLYQVKAIEPLTGEVYGAVLDAGGESRDKAAAVQAERDAVQTRYGRLEPALYDLLSTMAAEEVIEVGIWLKAEGVVPLERPEILSMYTQPNQTEFVLTPPDFSAGAPSNPVETDAMEEQHPQVEAINAEQDLIRAELDEFHQENSAHLQSQISALQAPMLSDLAVQGYTVTYASPLAPLVYVRLPKSEVLAFSQREDVDLIYGPNENKDLMDSAKPVQKADIVDNWFGYDGAGIDVAILEDSRVEFANPYLNAGTTRVPGDANVDSHATGTAGMVASQDTTYQGIAQGAYIFSANATDYGDANLSAAMDWSVNQGVDVINNSWGGNESNTNLNVHDRHLDYIVRHYYRTVTVAAGNENDGCGSGTGRVTSPARGFNMISVGNYQDFNSLTWIGDAMDPCSSYVNPSTGIEKPEVAAVGSSINSTTHLSPWLGNVGSGTSYSAPMVAGESAILMERNSALTTWPEIVKAAVMATAFHNIEGNTRLSDYDGAGGVDIRAAFQLIDQGWWHGRGAGSGDFPASYYLYAYEGELVRAAMAWDSNPASDYSTDPLQADLDLYAYTYPGGSYVTGSASLYNSYEVVEFVAPATGWYELRETAYSFTGTTEYVGIAWWPGHNVLTAYVPQVRDTPPISRDYYRVTPASYWNAIGFRSPSGGNYHIYMYSASAFGNPVNYALLEDSTISDPGWETEYVVLDRNHAPAGDVFTEIRAVSGTGDYATEFANHSSDTVGTYGPYSMTTSQVLRVWDSWLSSGERKYFAIRPTSGDAYLRIGLHDSDPGVSSSWYQGVNQVIAWADSGGAGNPVTMNYLNSGDSDWMGLVVWNTGSTSTTTFYLYTDTTAPSGSISINAGATYANSTSVTLNLSASDTQTGVYQMRFMNSGGSWTAWEPYTTSKSWTLPSGDGTKTVYVQYKNNAEMISQYSDAIVLDTVAPTGSISINGGATYAISTSVTLNLAASDATSGVAQMRFLNSGGSWTAWEPYSTTKAWTLLSGDGSKTVYVQYSDNAGNASGSYSDSITLDTAPPTGSVSINAGATYATSPSVTLNLSASDSLSGVSQMRTQNSGGSWTAWEPYATSKAWALVAGDGSKTVNVQFVDNAGNISSTYSDSIILDTVKPTGSISINGGATYTASTSVTLNLSASDATSGLDVMRFSNNGSTWSSWESYNTSKSWTLTATEGNQWVYVQYRDHAGHVSDNYSDSIILDTISPTGTIQVNGGAAYTTSSGVTLNLSASDATSGVNDMRFSNDNSTWSSWEAYSTSKAWTLSGGDGTKTVYVQYRDHAGNVSGSYSDTITLDTTGPTGSIQINGGATYANTSSVTLNLSASDAGAGVADMRFSDDGSTWTSWEPYGITKAWSLPAGDGSKTVFVQYRDALGQTSGNYSDSIVLDTTPPDVDINSPEMSIPLFFDVDWSGNDATSGVASFDIQYKVGTGGTYTNWLNGTTLTTAQFGPSSPITVGRGEVYIFRLRAWDNAGNVSDYALSPETETLVPYLITLPVVFK